MTRFRDRADAGRRLAVALSAYSGRPDVVVFGIARGGVPVAAEVALALGAPLDVIVIRKLGFPGQEELAMGAIGPGGVCVLNPHVTAELLNPDVAVQAAVRRELRVLEQRERFYRAGRQALSACDRAAIVIDDGLATGSTMRAALAVARAQGARETIAAVPVAAAQSLGFVDAACDRVVSLIVADYFVAVGDWYADFAPVSDEEVQALLTLRQPVKQQPALESPRRVRSRS